ncbi:MAG: SoxR reducing system RseC family protein [Gammaproteobacteria bacterium]|nr:SoxR reducing system RseC family protein [Gammaproteobacteria bacterium]
MIEETGQVVDVKGAFAWIESERTSTCGACNVRKGCGTAVLAKVFGQRRVHLRVLNRINAQVGDAVVIGIPESALVRGSLAVYAAPLAGLFAGAIAGDFLGNRFFQGGSDLSSIIGALVGITAGLVWLKRFSRQSEKDASYQPVILRKQTWSESVQGSG